MLVGVWAGNLLVRVDPRTAGVSQTAAGSYSFLENPGSYLYQWWSWLRGVDSDSGSYSDGSNSSRHVHQKHQVVLIDHGLYVHLNAHPTLQQEYVSFWMAIIYGDDAKLAEQCSR